MKKLSILILVSAMMATQASHAAVKNSDKKDNQEVVKKDDPRRDIFAEMEAMEKQMNQAFAKHREMMEKMFKDSKDLQKQSSGASLAMYQDQDSYRYELTFSSFKKEDVIVSVNGGVLTVSAKNEKAAADKKKGETQISNNFYYSMLIPSDAKPEPEITREEGKILIKFVKIIEKKEKK